MSAAERPVNIGPKGRRQRMGLAAVAFAVFVAGLVWIAAAHPPTNLRWFLAIPLFVAALGFFQAQAGT